jgi:hypothetical protein
MGGTGVDMSFLSEYRREIKPSSSKIDAFGRMHYYAANGEEVIRVLSIAAWAGEGGMVNSNYGTYPGEWVYKSTFHYRDKGTQGVNRDRK